MQLILLQNHWWGTKKNIKKKAHSPFTNRLTCSILTLPIRASHSWLSCTEPGRRENKMELLSSSCSTFVIQQMTKAERLDWVSQRLPGPSQVILLVLQKRGRHRWANDTGQAAVRDTQRRPTKQNTSFFFFFFYSINIYYFFMWYYTCFNAILPNHPPPPSPTESKRLFYTSVSLLLSRMQGCCYHLYKFHIYALVYCIGVFLSGLLHSV